MDIDQLVARRLLALRGERGLSLAQLAAASGVSKAMISRIERAESSATATVLGRLAAALGITLSKLLAEDERERGRPERLRRRVDQAVWRDPERGWRRRQVSEHDAATGIELVELELPRGTEVHYPRWSGRPYRQRLWLLAGALRVDYGGERFELAEGDCLDFGVDRALAFKALGRSSCRYLLVISAA